MKSPLIYLQKFYYWLLWRNKDAYNYRRRAKYLFRNIIMLFLSILSFFYSFKINLDLISFLLFTISFFIFIYSFYMILKEIPNWYKRQTNIAKIVCISVIVFIIYYIYLNFSYIFDWLNFLYQTKMVEIISFSKVNLYFSYIVFGICVILFLLGTIIPTSSEIKLVSWIVLIILFFTLLPYATNILESESVDKDISELTSFQKIFLNS